MPEFVLTDPPEAIAVRYVKQSGLSSAAVHLTDTRTGTLCGLKGTLVVVPKGEEATCRKCQAALKGEPRFRKMIR